MKIQIGVMGGASGTFPDEVVDRAYRLGVAIARADAAMVTGGCPGLPAAAIKGCDEAGGLTIGVSPAMSLDEHVNRYHSPTGFTDVMIYTGAGLMGREVAAVRSCDIVIIVAGRSGTLGEFSIAYDEGRLIGVLEGSGGITEILPNILRVIAKPTGARVIFDEDPQRLVDRLIEEYTKSPPRIRTGGDADLVGGPTKP